MRFLFSFFFFALTAHAVPDNKFAPIAKLQNTKYLEHCGGNFPDLADEMPPNDNQQNAPWCATFSTTAVLDYHVKKMNKLPDYRFRTSKVDVNWNNPGNTKAALRQLPDFRAEVSPNAQNLLEGVQTAGTLYSDEDLPVDQAYFDPNGYIARLSDYYDAQKDFAGKPSLPECRDQSAASVGIEAQFQELATILANNKTKESFMLDFARGRLVLPTPRASAQRVKIPPYNIRLRSPKSGDELVEELQARLHAREPVIMSVCSIAMMKLPYLAVGVMPVPPAERENCGPHQMVVIGMEKVDGQCQVHLRNSWGTAWGAEGNGNAWVPLKEFLNFSMGESLVSISARASGEAPNNLIEYRDGINTYQGQTRKLAPEGEGTLSNGAVTDQGKFKDGRMVEGKRTTKNGDTFSGKFVQGSFSEGFMSVKLVSEDGTYVGESKGGSPNGKGVQKGPGKTLLDGTFKEGEFIEGIYRGPYGNGGLYEGEFKNGVASGKGKLTSADGSAAVGTFEGGRLINGTVKGLFNPEKGIYYEGPVVNGVGTESFRYKDKDGNPWRPKQ